MLSSLQLLSLAVLMASSCQALKMSPAENFVKSPIRKRQQTASSEFPSTTTITTNFGVTSAQPNTCMCKLVTTYNPFVTITSTYTASDSNDGVTTTTIATQDGATPGTVEVITPVSYVTTTSYYDGAAPVTSTLAQPSGTSPGTILVKSPGIYTTYTSYGGQSSTITSTIVTYTGPSGTATSPGTIVVIRPASEAPVATGTDASVVSRYTAPASSAPPALPSDQATSGTGSAVPAPTGCNNQGLEWAEYTNVNGDWSRPGVNNDPPGYANFTPRTYKMRQPNYQGVVGNIAGFNYTPTTQGTITIYDSNTIASDYWVLNHQGYIYAAQSGIYNFTSYAADDIVLVWVGPIAYSGWRRSNAGLEQVYNDPPQGFTGYPGEPPVSFTVSLDAGQYYPFRIVFANAQRQAQFHLYVTAPDGSQFLGPDTPDSPYVVRYSCDQTTAPRFPAFGNQT